MAFVYYDLDICKKCPHVEFYGHGKQMLCNKGMFFDVSYAPNVVLRFDVKEYDDYCPYCTEHIVSLDEATIKAFEELAPFSAKPAGKRLAIKYGK